MKWVRTLYKDLVSTITLGKPFIYDPSHYEPYYLTKANYMPLFREADDDLAIVEMDIALSREDRFKLEGHINRQPEIVHVAPYKHYGYRPAYIDHSFIHRYSYMNFCKEDDPYCFYFGFGCIYIPLQKIRDYLTDIDAYRQVYSDRSTLEYLPKDFANDVFFSWWHATVTDNEPVPVHWDVRPTHLNYSLTTRSGRLLGPDESEVQHDY